jgi:hypothetical protein
LFPATGARWELTSHSVNRWINKQHLAFYICWINVFPKSVDVLVSPAKTSVRTTLSLLGRTSVFLPFSSTICSENPLACCCPFKDCQLLSQEKYWFSVITCSFFWMLSLILLVSMNVFNCICNFSLCVMSVSLTVQSNEVH